MIHEHIHRVTKVITSKNKKLKNRTYTTYILTITIETETEEKEIVLYSDKPIKVK